MNDQWIIRIAAFTLALIMVSVILVLLAGLFNPNVDNKEIFEILKPAFQTVVGALVGIVASRKTGK